jgi:co-chaperonin GroES (HSP10)
VTRIVFLTALVAGMVFVAARGNFTSRASDKAAMATAPRDNGQKTPPLRAYFSALPFTLAPVCTTDPVVVNNSDSGAGSLRQAIIDACDASTITFNMAMVTNPITLTTAELSINNNLTINGPGSSLLTVQRSTAGGTPNFRIFTINSGKNVVISGLTITNGHVTGTFPTGAGGGILNDRGTLTLNECVVSGNSATGGGGISNGATQGGTLTINNSTVSGNTGGGINNTVVVGDYSNPATLKINGSTISGNSSSGIGGGIINNVASRGIATLTINDSTISANSASGNGSAGGIYNALIFGTVSDVASTTINNSTIFGNSSSANDGSGGIVNAISCVSGCAPTVSLGNTILAGNFLVSGSAPRDFVGTADPNSSFNLVGTGGSGGLVNGVNNNQVGVVDPLLGPLANNGGPTLTHALLSGSPALDGGSNMLATSAGLTTDQRGAGFNRARDAADADTVATVDIGAFEAQASVEDITDKSIAEDTALSFGFNVGDANAITNVTASSGNTTLVPNAPANISLTGSGSTRTLNITPTTNQSGASTITVTVTSGSESMSDTFVLTVTPVADTPSVTNATTNEDTQTTSGLVISRNAADGAEVTNFKITAITNGTLFKNNGTTQINNGDFITFAEGNAGLKFTPAANLFSPTTTPFSFDVQGATDGSGSGLSPTATATITVSPVADVPSVTPATTIVNTQTTSGLVISRNAVDGTEVTHFKITNITNGTLFKSDGTTQITNGTFITFAEANAGLKFTPAHNLASPSSNFSFQVQGATSSSGAGLGSAATATITVTCGADNIVTNTNDSGAGSLRNAINTACPGDTITFAASLTSGGPAIITLTSAELVIDKNLTITGTSSSLLTISGNSASRVFNIQSGTVIISGLTIASGKVTGGNSGGGLLNRGALTLKDCTISGNSAANAGGGIVNDGQNGTATLTITNSTISGNSAPSFGGGIFNNGFNGNATVNVINSTISGNGAPSFGGGLYNAGNGGTATLNITDSTIAGNTGSSGGGIYNFGNGGTGIVNSSNTIVSDNTASIPAEGPDIFNFNGTVSGSNNLIQTSIGYTISGSNNIHADPMLEKDGLGNLVLKNNGGPTKTVLVLLGSPAINAGSNALLPLDTLDLDSDGNTGEVLPLDQRGAGFNRIVNTTVDIGAVETNYTVTATAGTPQSAVINTAFGALLQATVQESGVNQSGVTVTFTAPAGGASGTFPGNVTTANATTDASGVATAPVFTANGNAGGPYNVVASLAGGSPDASFSLTNEAPTATTVLSSVNPSDLGQNVTFTATVTGGPGLPTGAVQFTDGASNLGNSVSCLASGVNTCTAQVSTSTLTTGTHTISATYSGDSIFLGSSGTLSGGQVVTNQPALLLILDESGPDVKQAAAFDSFLFVRDPFHVQSIVNWFDLGPDRNTRVIIFAANLQLNQGESASAVVVNLVDANNQSFDVPAEDVRAVPNFGFTQVKFRLPDNLAAGVCMVTIRAHGQISNTGTIRIVLP